MRTGSVSSVRSPPARGMGASGRERPLPRAGRHLRSGACPAGHRPLCAHDEVGLLSREVPEQLEVRHQVQHVVVAGQLCPLDPVLQGHRPAPPAVGQPPADSTRRGGNEAQSQERPPGATLGWEPDTTQEQRGPCGRWGPGLPPLPSSSGWTGARRARHSRSQPVLQNVRSHLLPRAPRVHRAGKLVTWAAAGAGLRLEHPPHSRPGP